jgi:hypothetical protein
MHIYFSTREYLTNDKLSTLNPLLNIIDIYGQNTTKL